MAGERALVDCLDSRGPQLLTQQLFEVAAALVAIDALREERALDIVYDYQLAESIRGRGMPFRMLGPPMFQAPRRGSSSLAGPRVVACEAVLEYSWGRLHAHYVCFDDHSTSVAITARESAPGRLFASQPMRLGGSVTQPPLTDDTGRTEIAQFRGGGGGGQGFRGRLVTAAPLSQTTRWIDIGPERIDLSGPSPRPPFISLQPLPDEDPAERYLWGRMSAGRHGPHGGPRPPDIETAIETLVAAGALDPDNPVIEQVREVFEAFSNRATGRPLPPPWSALLAGLPRGNGPSGIVPLGTVLPPLDGLEVCLVAVLVENGAFEVHVASSAPGSMSPSGQSGSPASLSWILGSPITWWASDDLENVYLGSAGGRGPGRPGHEETVTFWPALDPGATRLLLMPTGKKERAVVSVALPWSHR